MTEEMTNKLSPYTYHAWLASAQLPLEALSEVLERFGNPRAFFEEYRQGRDQDIRGITEPCRRMLTFQADPRRLSQFSQIMETHGIRAFSIGDPEYPPTLEHIADPPVILFYQGNTECLKRRSLAVVGSRRASYSGQKAARDLARELSRKGITIVSGMAYGIDGEAHAGCLEGGSPTVAVIGCGLDRTYPQGHQKLKEEILEQGGLLLSEYAPGEKPLGWHFPVRNRILSGISQAMILMEARIRSGSMSSVQHALNQGKDVFVYPGDPLSSFFEANHQLLREGAVYFTKADDILEDLGWLDNPSSLGHNSECSTEPVHASEAEKAVFYALKRGSLSLEQLADITGIELPVLLGTLTLMQISGRIEALPGKMFQIKESNPPEGSISWRQQNRN